MRPGRYPPGTSNQLEDAAGQRGQPQQPQQQRLDTLVSRFSRPPVEGYSEESQGRRFSNPLPGVRDLLDHRKSQNQPETSAPPSRGESLPPSLSHGRLVPTQMLGHMLPSSGMRSYLPLPGQSSTDLGGGSVKMPASGSSQNQQRSFSAPSALQFQSQMLSGTGESRGLGSIDRLLGPTYSSDVSVGGTQLSQLPQSANLPPRPSAAGGTPKRHPGHQMEKHATTSKSPSPAPAGRQVPTHPGVPRDFRAEQQAAATLLSHQFPGNLGFLDQRGKQALQAPLGMSLTSSGGPGLLYQYPYYSTPDTSSHHPQVWYQPQGEEQRREMAGGLREETGAAAASSEPGGSASKRRERWTKEEHEKFLEGLEKFGRKWKKIQHLVKTKTAVQVRTHAYGYFAKLLRNVPEEEGLWEVAQIMSSLPSTALRHMKASSEPAVEAGPAPEVVRTAPEEAEDNQEEAQASSTKEEESSSSSSSEEETLRNLGKRRSTSSAPPMRKKSKPDSPAKETDADRLMNALRLGDERADNGAEESSGSGSSSTAVDDNNEASNGSSEPDSKGEDEEEEEEEEKGKDKEKEESPINPSSERRLGLLFGRKILDAVPEEEGERDTERAGSSRTLPGGGKGGMH